METFFVKNVFLLKLMVQNVILKMTTFVTGKPKPPLFCCVAKSEIM